MMKIDLRKIYKFTPVTPPPAPGKLPTGGDLYYECTDCSVIISSVPRIESACACGNLKGGDGKVVIQDPAKVNVVRGKLK
ncbi:MAG: hypothetical protein FWD77_07355 [Betaproteobacteria bacterium]|nr:hypothetical protein [Betaproteobacteria bacterium]